MNEEINKINSVEIKPSYDGRLEYFKSVGLFMSSFAIYKIQDNINGMYNSLEGLYIMVAPYIKMRFRKEIEQQLHKAASLLGVDNLTARKALKSTLTSTAIMIQDYAKHIMLPQGLNDADEEVDWEKFMQ